MKEKATPVPAQSAAPKTAKRLVRVKLDGESNSQMQCGGGPLCNESKR